MKKEDKALFITLMESHDSSLLHLINKNTKRVDLFKYVWNVINKNLGHGPRSQVNDRWSCCLL